ncbi:metal-dependent phosphohydrolase [Paenibacillus swuensis]|uniref:Metal-dependent phosphohydrolase n=1 Tax=Paenibacillus swuensis TaxID=1178515 RepID=A0A172TFV3_9BACL|nr:HD-GYP domain-containing protein [Paenibacillus swuensis]ANE45945.1 metal-dependent phosphohydrolase [Paenibacillus swuensis]
MRKVHISSVRPGEKIAKPLFTETGSVLLGVGVELNDRYIERLKNLGIDTVYIEDVHTEDLFPEDSIRDETRNKAVEAVHKTMTGLMDVKSVKGRASVPEIGNTFRKVFGTIMQDLSTRKEVLVNLSNMHTMDGYLFHHSVNVAVLSGIIGIAKGYNQSQLADLGVGALLFDVGMMNIPKEVWNKNGPLTDDERGLVQRHAEDGYNMLRNQFDVSLLSAHCALQHHERYDGHGYPRGISGKDMHEYAQIVAIADVYDALTSPRLYRKRYSPSEAIEFLFASGNQYFDLDLVRLFCRHISIYPIASTVELNTGQVGVVSAVNPNSVQRPTIRILKEADGTDVASPYEIDLHAHYSYMITKTL